MTYQSTPTADGVYLIKVLSKNLFIESVLDNNPKLRLAAPSPNNNQKWNLTQVPNKVGVWKMTCVEGGAGITYTVDKKVYRGYGYPYPHTGSSQEWNFIDRDETFSKIKLNDGLDCFDSCQPGSNHIHFYSDQKHPSSAPNQCYVFQLIPPEPEPEPEPEPKKSLDVIFLQDSTGSQGPYIDGARNQINQICKNLITLSTGELADDTFVTQGYDFTSNPSTMASYLGRLEADSGGDGPEAQTDALMEALNSSWKEGATKVVVLITDSPPHGLGERGDGFPGGCPCGYDPLRVAEDMLRSGITLYVVACEPEMSRYQRARQFYEGLTRKTGGYIYNLGDPSGLTTVIVGCLLQEADSDTLVAHYQSAIRREASSGKLSPEEIARKLHEDLSNAKISHYSLSLDDMVEMTEEGEKNVQEWYEAANLAAAKGKIKAAPPNRIKPEYASGGAPTSSMEKKPITLTQVEGIVRKSLYRRH
ncbi:hypothetical protein B0J17DRAFT_772466 [Rhizoctonia solani]|nr:hypothetical protein B0J17DRAFT_772466 [Rhizoctonia solani]